MTGCDVRIGIDFDNTIADYSDVFARVATELGMLDSHFKGNKTEVREALRAGAGGEQIWQRLQGQVYGRYMPLARPMSGVKDFFHSCRDNNVTVQVISHKTVFGHFDPAHINLRAAAMTWLEENAFFDVRRSTLGRDDVIFEATRADKVHRIAQANLDHYIDDLAEVFSEPHFPPAIKQYLLGANGYPHWNNIREAIFGA